MAPSLRSALALALWASYVCAEKYDIQQFSWYRDFYPQPNQYCFSGCQTVVGSITFEIPAALAAETDYYVLQCGNTLQIQSTFTCAQAYCTYDEAVAGRRFMVTGCEKIGVSVPTIDDYLLSDSALAAIPRINSTAALATAEAPLNRTVIPDAEWQALGERTLVEFYLTWDLGYTFSFVLVGFWALAIIVGMVYRVLEMLKTRNTPDMHSRESSVWLYIRKKLILPATFGKHCQEATVVGTIPPRLETILLLVYLIINFIFCFPAYNIFVGNQYYSTKKMQLARYIADRTGFLAIAQFPMVWVFAARNDPFMWLTGWSFATYNRFHRWIARISTVHAIAHSIAYSLFAVYSSTPTYDSYAESWKEEYYYAGAISTVVMSLMLGASAYYFRARCYDLFLIVHIGMSVIVLVCLWYHVRIFQGAFAYYIWPCIAIWGIDRLLRIVRTLYVSVVPRFTKGVKATASYNPSTEMVRLDITEFFPEKPIVPGHFYYLYLPNGLRGYESHPFTMCSWLRPESSAATSPTGSFAKGETKTQVRSTSEDLTKCEVTHTFLVRPYAGMTARLQKKLANSVEANTTQETIFLEGPYGDALDLSRYSDVLVICGGSGITAAISHANFLMSKNNCTTRVHIVWAVPQRHLPDDVCANELSAVIQNTRVNMVVYLTGQAEEEARDPEKLPVHPPYEIRSGRPDIKGAMEEYRRQSSHSLAIVTCGTPQMADTCRAAVVSLLEEDGPDVGYYNDSMVW